MKTYKVGGAVRDRLLNQPVKDTDWLVLGATPEQMIEQGFKTVGKDFPVFLHPHSKEEYALARTEKKVGQGYKGFEFYTSPEVTLEEDLLRRDLTINAMVEDDEGNVIDPYNGQQDLKDGILRHVSPAFVEDPLRVVRLARFAARFGFKVAPETMQLLKQIVASGEMQTLTPERVWTELEKALAGKYPARFILVMQACGALQEILPEVNALFGVPQTEKYHPEIDSGLHTLMSLNQVTRITDDTEVRFAVLVHDLGKALTPDEVLPGHRGHEQDGLAPIAKLCQRLKVPKQYQQLAELVCKHHLECHKLFEMKASTIVKKLEQMDAFRRPERFQQFLLACTADARGRRGYEDSDYPQAEAFARYRDLCAAINAKEFAEQGLQGEQIAEAIRLARIEVLKKEISARKTD